MRLIALLLAVLLLGVDPALAQKIPSLSDLVPAGDGTASGRMLQLVLVITVLSVAPGLLDHGDLFHPLRAGAVVPARRAWPADHARPTSSSSALRCS